MSHLTNCIFVPFSLGVCRKYATIITWADWIHQGIKQCTNRNMWEIADFVEMDHIIKLCCTLRPYANKILTTCNSIPSRRVAEVEWRSRKMQFAAQTKRREETLRFPFAYHRPSIFVLMGFLCNNIILNLSVITMSFLTTAYFVLWEIMNQVCVTNRLLAGLNKSPAAISKLYHFTNSYKVRDYRTPD